MCCIVAFVLIELKLFTSLTFFSFKSTIKTLSFFCEFLLYPPRKISLFSEIGNNPKLIKGIGNFNSINLFSFVSILICSLEFKVPKDFEYPPKTQIEVEFIKSAPT